MLIPVLLLNDVPFKSSIIVNQKFGKGVDKVRSHSNIALYHSLKAYRNGRHALNDLTTRVTPKAPNKCVPESIRKGLEVYYPKSSTKVITYKRSYAVSSRNIFLPYSNYGNFLNKLDLSDCSKDSKQEAESESSGLMRLPLINYPVNISIRRRCKGSFLGTESSHNKSFEPLKRLAKKFANRMIKEYGYRSRAGQMSTGNTKQNQDSIIMEANFGGDGNSHFFAVADGHGQFGEKVSFFIKSTLPRLFLP